MGGSRQAKILICFDVYAGIFSYVLSVTENFAACSQTSHLTGNVLRTFKQGFLKGEQMSSSNVNRMFVKTCCVF